LSWIALQKASNPLSVILFSETFKSFRWVLV
jgi:hypothetical protein